ncbi:S-layer homology domain-containing protein [Okeania sp.]|uniref:WD40 domain-containing protein n=1 Tax=Okeania sp. TaxID=3100323 RepID=UPI002B4B28E5|nr:S-layer homology domain-containing protein [Okeania sp.]MEB3343109.1 S-layer homology domain-containing protein [Okeania sp.]
MMKIYKLHSILALVITLSSIITPELFYRKNIRAALAETTLEDNIENNFAQACINSLLEKNIVFREKENQTFLSNSPVTRAEFATIITKAFPDTKPVRDSIKFVDIPQDYWAYNNIQKSYEMGFISAYIGKTFNPTFKIKRWQALVAISRGLKYRASASSEENLNKIFEDAEAIPKGQDIRKAIAAATEKGIVVNYPNVRKLNPNQDATQLDVATFICQAIANNEKNNGEIIAKVPSEYIADFSKDSQLRSNVNLPQKTTETNKNRENANLENSEPTSPENTNSQSTTEAAKTQEHNHSENPKSTSTENTNNPTGIVEKFSNGDLQVEIIYKVADNINLVSDLRLKIIRGGKIIFHEAVPIQSLAGESDSKTEVLVGRFVKVQLLDLDGNGESEILVDLFTINNSDVEFSGGSYSLIYAYQPTENKYKMLPHYWGNVNYRLTDLDNDNLPEFQTFDSRFNNVFSEINDSVLPIRIWQYRGGKISDVTKKYPEQINTNASENWLEFYNRSKQNKNVKGVLAAYLANKYMLGEKEEGWKLVEKVYKGSDRTEYFTSLRQFLIDKGYDTNQETTASTIVPENSATENQETVSSPTNETSLQLTTEKTENENTKTETTEVPETSSPTPITASPETVTPEPEKSETQSDISDKLVLAPKLVSSLSNEQPESAFPAAISFNGKILASTSGKDIQLWDLKSSKLLHTLSSHTANVRSVAISPDGKILASGSGDGTVRLWDISRGKIITSFWHSGVVTAVGFTADGKAVIGSSFDRGMKLWDVSTKRLLHTMTGTQPIAFGAEGLRMAASGGPRYIRLWNFAQGQLLKNLPVPNTNKNRGIQAIAFSQDGETIAHVMRGENQISVWDVETWKVRYTLEKHSQAIKAIALAPNGKILASSSEDGKINLWDIDSGKLLRSIEGDGAIVFSPDSQQLVSVAENDKIQIWQIYQSASEQ